MAPGSGHSAAVYLVDTIGAMDGVYRATNMGATWVRFDDEHRNSGIDGIVADTGVYGRVFTRGHGMNHNE